MRDGGLVMAALELVVTRAQEGRTVKSLLKGELGFSTALIGRLKRTETGLTVNGRRVFTSAVLREGDRLSVDLPAAERPTELRPVPMALDVRFEDEHLLVVNKPAGLASIPSSQGMMRRPFTATGVLWSIPLAGSSTRPFWMRISAVIGFPPSVFGLLPGGSSSKGPAGPPPEDRRRWPKGAGAG